MIYWSAADICSLKNISQLSVEINLFSVARRCAQLARYFTTINVTFLSQVVIECQKHDDYQEAIRWFLDNFKEYTTKSYNNLNQAGGHVKDASKVFVFL